MPKSSRRVFWLLLVLAVCVLGIPPEAFAADCGDVRAGAKRVTEDPENFGFIFKQHGSVCVVTDADRGQFDYYTTSEARCKQTPGMIEWQKDRGSGRNVCVFRPPSAPAAEPRRTPSPPPATGPDSCRYAKDGDCDEPNLCARGTDTTDCARQPAGPDSCQFAKDGTCDEPNICPRGTDTTDCSRQTAGADSCVFANDGACDEPNLCARGTDTTDCSRSDRPPMTNRPTQTTFRLTVCNKSSERELYVAVHGRQGDDWIVEGWWTVARGACDALVTLRKGEFHVFAEGGSTEWSGDFPICVAYPGPFKRVNTAGYTCDSKLLKKFEKLETNSNTFTYNLTSR